MAAQLDDLNKLAFLVQSLAAENKVNDIIALLDSKTTPNGPIHPDNENEISIWNLPAYLYYMKKGQYSEAEKIYRALLSNLLKNQKAIGRVHKGLVYHNLGLALFFQGNTEEGIKFFLFAYTEDVIRGKGALQIEYAPASRVLQGICGVPQQDLFTIRKVVLSSICKEIPLEPNFILTTAESAECVKKIQENYHKYISNTWKMEKDGQHFLESGSYKTSFDIYTNWFNLLIDYQKHIETRVHKGHPLFNAGASSFLAGKKDEAVTFLLLAYIEDVISSFKIGDADNSPAFKNLSSIMLRDSLKEIEAAVVKTKEDGKNVDNPADVLKSIDNLIGKARKGFEEQRQRILDTKKTQEDELFKKIASKKEITDEIDNTLFVLKKWNSITPRYPIHEPVEAYGGGGYFLILNKKGIVIDPGYDFLRYFYSEGFGVQNIDMIIVTHAHDDHCQDLEAIFSILYKLNRAECEHKIDIITSEGVQIKYSRLLTIIRNSIHDTILQPGKQFDPSSLSGKPYGFTIQATRTKHHEEPWMKNNTGFGLVLSIKINDDNQFKLGLTSDTAFWDGLEQEFEGSDLLIEHIGTYGTSVNHLTDLGCIELLKRVQVPPKLVIVSEFGYELRSNRVNICRSIENLANRQTAQSVKVPVIAGDISLKVQIPSLKIFCSDTSKFEEYSDVIDKEIRDNIEYLKRE